MLANKSLNWTAVAIGMCMGAGMLFIPVQVGLSGLWPFIISIPFVVVIDYFGQKYIGDVVNQFEDEEKIGFSYSDIVNKVLGRFIGKMIVILYFLMLIALLIVYISGFKNDLFAFFQTYFPQVLGNKSSILFLLAIVLFFYIIVYLKDVILMVVFKFKTAFMMTVLLIFSLMIIPHWHLITLENFPSHTKLIKGIFSVIPIMVTGTLFFPIVSEMALSFRHDKKYEDRYTEATRKVILNSTFIILFFVTFFVISYSLAVSKEQVVYAAAHNQTAMSVIKGSGIGFVGKWIGLLALPASFLGIFIATIESAKNLFIKHDKRVTVEDVAHNRKIDRILTLILMILVFIILFFHVPLLEFIGSFITPILAIMCFIIPAFLAIKLKTAGRLWVKILVICGGFFIMVSYYISSLV